MKCNQKCSFFEPIGNTDETGMGICCFCECCESVSLNEPCQYDAPKYTCGDCLRYEVEDSACYTSLATDSAYITGHRCEPHLCPGFIDKRELQIDGMVHSWIANGLDVREELNRVMKDAMNLADKLNKRNAETKEKKDESDVCTGC